MMSNTQLNSFTVHPHTCGEHISHLVALFLKTSSSPYGKETPQIDLLVIKERISRENSTDYFTRIATISYTING